MHFRCVLWTHFTAKCHYRVSWDPCLNNSRWPIPCIIIYMKTKITFALSTIVLLAGLTSCGKSSSNNSANSTDAYYKQCQNDPTCYNQLFTNQFGPNSNGYNPSYQNFGGYNCQTYTIPSYNNYGNYGTQQYVVAPQGAYLPQYGINGTGGSFSVGARFGWN